MATIEQVLAGRNLTGLVQGIKSGIPMVLPESFYRESSRAANGKLIEWNEVDGTRETARLVQYGSPAVRRGLQGIKQKSATALHTFETQQFDGHKLINLVNPNTGQLDPKGEAEVSRQTKEFKSLFANLRTSAVQMALLTGTIHFDAAGNLLPSSSGAFVSVDFNVPAGNKDQLDILGGGDLIDASWATASTEIITHLRKIKSAALKKTGYPIVHAIYGSNIPKYLANNTQAKEYLIRNPQANQSFLDTGEVPAGLGGLNWSPGEDAFYVDQAGAIQSFVGDDDLILLPEPSDEWYELIPGSYMVPNDVGMAGQDAVGALASMDEATGMFSYAAMSHNPPSIEQFAGDTFLPVIKVPGAMFIADVTP